MGETIIVAMVALSAFVTAGVAAFCFRMANQWRDEARLLSGGLLQIGAWYNMEWGYKGECTGAQLTRTGKAEYQILIHCKNSETLRYDANGKCLTDYGYGPGPMVLGRAESDNA